MKVAPYNPDTLKEAISILKNGGVVAHPADTCYGLAGDLMNPEAFKKIQDIKGRDYNKPMSVMLSVMEQLQIKKYALLDSFSSYVVGKLFPGAVTLILPKGPEIPSYYFPETPNIGLRIPLHDITQDILLKFKGSLITTSANPSGSELCFTHKEVIKAFENNEFKPDLIFEGKLNNHNLASTVIEVKKDFVQIVRKGPVTANQLKTILGVLVKE
jgi:L-threonylcarbamoyladenylate synthase